MCRRGYDMTGESGHVETLVLEGQGYQMNPVIIAVNTLLFFGEEIA